MIIGCMCIECMHNEIVQDNHDNLHRICTRCESEYFLKEVSTAFGECDFGEVDTDESEDTK